MYSFKDDFNLKTILLFRDDVVNDDNGFTFQYYQKNDTKEGIVNTWNKICSCADWIQASVNSLQKDVRFKKSNVSIYFLHFIITLDSLTEGIKNMWISFGFKYPFSKQKDIFHGKILEQNVSDDTYFKHLRAFLGVHSVNGKEITVDLNHNGKPKTFRFFSSWTNKYGNDFETVLYSNNDQAEQLYGGPLSININLLVKYASAPMSIVCTIFMY